MNQQFTGTNKSRKTAAATTAQLSAILWCRVLNVLPLHERWEPRLVCKRLLKAASPWRPPVFVIVASPGTGGEQKLSRATPNPGGHVQATLREALSCYKLFRQKEPSRLFEIRLGSGVHETGMKVYSNSRFARDSPGIISVNDIGGFNLEGSNCILVHHMSSASRPSNYSVACAKDAAQFASQNLDL